MLKQAPHQIMEDMLESDDELPSEYIEDSDIPVYQNDRRFDTINFNWVDTNFSKYYRKKNNENQVLLSALYSSLNEDVVNQKTENLRLGKSLVILSAVLNQQDIYCLKCVEPIASDATLFWFVNFLLYKDLQSNFSFLKSCLVDAIPNKNTKMFKKNTYSERKNFKFDIVI